MEGLLAARKLWDTSLRVTVRHSEVAGLCATQAVAKRGGRVVDRCLVASRLGDASWVVARHSSGLNASLVITKWGGSVVQWCLSAWKLGETSLRVTVHHS